MDIYQPYTYLIGWTSIDKWYYGVRYAKGCSPKDLWTTYFTSSKVVKAYKEKYGDPDIIQIRKTFDNRHAACLWESTVLFRLKAAQSNKWLNLRNCGIVKEASFTNPKKSISMMGTNNIAHRENVKEKLRAAWTPERKALWSLQMKQRTGVNHPNFGKPAANRSQRYYENLNKPKYDTIARSEAAKKMWQRRKNILL